MKKVLFYLSMLLMLSIFITSCSKDKEPDKTTNPFAYVGKLHNQGLDFILKSLKSQQTSFSSNEGLKNIIHDKCNEFMKIYALPFFKGSITKSAGPAVSISGIVTDLATGIPIIGAIVEVEGTTIGTTTNADGIYELNVPANSVLTFSFIGYYRRIYPVTYGRVIDVTLQESQEEDITTGVVEFTTYIPQPAQEIGINSPSGENYYNRLMNAFSDNTTDQSSFNQIITQLESDILADTFINEEEKNALLCGTAIAVESVNYWVQNIEAWSNINNNSIAAQAVVTKMPIVVSGRVSDRETGVSLPGVTINQVFTTIGATTNIMGDYSINASYGDATLNFAFLGYVPQHINIAGRSIINVYLKEETFWDTEWGMVLSLAIHDGLGGVVSFLTNGSVEGAVESSLYNSLDATQMYM